jgi:hypothetical protein
MDTIKDLEITCDRFDAKAVLSSPHHYDVKLYLGDVHGDFLDQIPASELINHYDNRVLLDELDDDVMYEYLEQKGMI